MRIYLFAHMRTSTFVRRIARRRRRGARNGGGEPFNQLDLDILRDLNGFVLQPVAGTDLDLGDAFLHRLARRSELASRQSHPTKAA
jgi:hypothetical protein